MKIIPLPPRKQYDTDPFSFQLFDADGAVDCSGATVVIYARNHRTGALLWSAECTMSNAATGVGSYTPQAADVATALTLRIEIHRHDVEPHATFPSDGYYTCEIQASEGSE